MGRVGGLKCEECRGCYNDIGCKCEDSEGGVELEYEDYPAKVGDRGVREDFTELGLVEASPSPSNGRR